MVHFCLNVLNIYVLIYRNMLNGPSLIMALSVSFCSSIFPSYIWCSVVRCMCAYSLSHVQLFVIPWTAARQAPLSMGIIQARILEWIAMPSSSGSSQPRDRTQVSHIADRFFTIWTTREASVRCKHINNCYCFLENWTLYCYAISFDFPDTIF